MPRSTIEQADLRRPSRWLALDLLVWFAVALLFAVQGHFVGSYRGTPQPWWPSLGYSLAIFSIWAIISPLIALAVRRARSRRVRTWPLVAACVAGLPIAAALHVALFALLYWPIYNGDGAIPTRRAMAERMALSNLDTNALFYVIVVGAALAWTALGRGTASPTSETPASDPSTGQLRCLQVRSKGRLKLISTAEIDWIAAADDYAEVHSGDAVHLVETTLAALEKQLSPAEFGRIHRGAIVRLDRVAEVRSLGRGDAVIRLSSGVELRMSRRYRANLASVLDRRRRAHGS